MPNSGYRLLPTLSAIPTMLIYEQLDQSASFFLVKNTQRHLIIVVTRVEVTNFNSQIDGLLAQENVNWLQLNIGIGNF